MFKPKVYKSNGLEAYHLINEEGGSFLYEGSVEYSEGELFKDEQGRTFYLVTTEIGGPAKYYVEVEPEGRPIPSAAAVKKDKDISELVLASPREEAEAIPEDQAREPEPPEPMAPPRDTCFESPEKAPEATPEKAAEPAAQPPTEAGEAQAAVKAMAALGEHRPPKKRFFSLPVIAVLIIAIVVIAAAGIVILKPGLVSGISLPFAAQPTPTPTPEITATPEPTPELTATPLPTATDDIQPGSQTDLVRKLLPLVPALQGNNSSMAAYANNTTNPMGTSYGKLARVCDLYDGVNAKWSLKESNGAPQTLNESVQAMAGSLADYSVLMAALAEAEGYNSRVVVVYNEDTKAYVYYPEIKVATNSPDYTDAAAYLRGRYDVRDPYHQVDGTDYWLSLYIGKNPGLSVDSKYAYTINSRSDIQPV